MQRSIFEILNVLGCSFWKNGDRALIIYGEYQTRIRTFLTRPLAPFADVGARPRNSHQTNSPGRSITSIKAPTLARVRRLPM